MAGRKTPSHPPCDGRHRPVPSRPASARRPRSRGPTGALGKAVGTAPWSLATTEPLRRTLTGESTNMEVATSNERRAFSSILGGPSAFRKGCSRAHSVPSSKKNRGHQTALSTSNATPFGLLNTPLGHHPGSDSYSDVQALPGMRRSIDDATSTSRCSAAC